MGEEVTKPNCIPLNSGPIPDDCEIVRVLAPDNSAIDPDKPAEEWRLCADTTTLRKEGWSRPPGSQWLAYIRRADAFEVKPKSRQVTRKRERPITVARFSLSGTVLTSIKDTILMGENTRHYLQGIYGKMNGNGQSGLFSGKDKDGNPLSGHIHAFFRPTDEDGDGKIDHITVFARGDDGMGFQEKGEIHAFDRFRKIHQGGGKPDADILLSGLGEVSDFPDVPIFKKSKKWRSITPFVLPRHMKSRGKKRETPVEQLLDELGRRGFPAPISIVFLESRELKESGRTIRWLEFRRERVKGGGKNGGNMGYGFEIEFAEAVPGPIALGYGCHFGLGLFEAAQS